MARYTMIDNASGYVWGTAEGDTPADACRAMDAEIGPGDPRGYVEHGPRYQPASNATGYWVYAATARDDFGGNDGADPEYVADVSDRECVAYVECLPAGDE
jgi:hypothetical protein